MSSLIAACTTGPDSGPASLPRVGTLDSAVPGNPTLAGIPGRLLVLGTDGEISTMRADGTERVTLAGADPSVERTQPTWSPDGSQVAWTERVADQEAHLVVAEGGGRTLTSTPAPVMAVYIAWKPDGSLLAMSGNDEKGNLLLATAVPGQSIEVVDQGAPLYFDWTPDGSSLLVRTSDRFEYVPVDGSARTPVPATGTFRLGVHFGDSVVLATARDIGDALAVADRQGGIRRQLLRYAGAMAYVVGPDDEKLAVMTRGSPESQRLAGVKETDVPILEPNRLVTVEAGSGQIHEVAPARGVAWFWSPDERLLLYSTLEFVDNVERLQWHTWNGEQSTSYRAFSPTGIFGRDYLAFFDQFARSMSLWAPDGSAFAYAGGSSLEDAGIWVQPVGGGDPHRVSTGEMAMWSPTP